MTTVAISTTAVRPHPCAGRGGSGWCHRPRHDRPPRARRGSRAALERDRRRHADRVRRTDLHGRRAFEESFLDATSGRWQEQRWKNKLAAGFTNSAGLNGDKLATLQQLALFAMQHSMIWVGLGLLPATTPQRARPTTSTASPGSSARWRSPMPTRAPVVPPWPIVEPPSTWAAESPRRPNAGTTCAALPPKRSHERRANPDRGDGARRGDTAAVLRRAYHSDTERLARAFHRQAVYASATGSVVVRMTT